MKKEQEIEVGMKGLHECEREKKSLRTEAGSYDFSGMFVDTDTWPGALG